MSTSEEKFITEIKKQLDESVDNLDGATRSRLNRMRSQALDFHDAKPRTDRIWLLTGGALLPALTLALFVYFGIPRQHVHDQQTSQVAASHQETTSATYDLAVSTPSPELLDTENLKILMSTEELEMLSDLDFLTWLTHENDEVGG
ncbi:MAG: hypothetical protein KKD73_00060 [Proteobacteria bacterium]|nr:hypothetical protein [Pseudomonadota bacterium]MBU1639075.1 hypothetical protein [Pseudomonadota bacterium]